MQINELTHEIIAAAIEVHRDLGPGLLESAYEECLCHELNLRGIRLERRHPLRLEFKGRRLTYLKLGGWKVGLLINFNVIVLKKGIRRLVLGLEENQKLSALSANSAPVR